MEQDSTENKLDKVDSYLTKFGIILKKHWGKLLIILAAYCIYEVTIWVVNLPDPDDNEEVQQDLPENIYYIDSLSGDTVYYNDNR
jgi:hypothetical protein